MYRLCRGPQPHAIPAGLLDYLGIFKPQILDGRHHDSVALLLGVGERVGHPLILGLHGRKVAQVTDQVLLTRKVKAGQLADNVVIQAVLKRHRNNSFSVAEVDILHLGGLYVFVVAQVAEGVDYIAGLAHPAGALFNAFEQRQPDAVVVVKRGGPFGQLHGNFGHRELVEHQLEDMPDILCVKVKAAHQRHRNLVLGLKLVGQRD